MIKYDDNYIENNVEADGEALPSAHPISQEERFEHDCIR